MKKDPIHPLRVLSALLQYPNEDWWHQMPHIEKAVADLPSKEMKKCMDAFLGYLKTHSLIHLQECYTAAFDLNPSTTLNLTYHIYGDNEKRADVLARLQQSYQDAGYERTTGELPDYLPLMLEFLSVGPDTENTDLIWECLRGIEDYVARLQQTAPPYASLLRVLVDVAAERLPCRADHLHPVASSRH
ncbi:MAG: nitrate reductase molybdenum cofactor assembly chaperone [Desulfobacterales bacterium]|nr:MAG: nitrate reductase molybdenum cofactor assembly chaperone [Desulfobacterales bacterium]